MPRALLDVALAYAEHGDRPVQAAIWLRAARVTATFDRPAAERLIARGVAAARTLEPSDRDPLMHTAVSMAATVTPALALALVESELTGHLQDGAVSQAFFHMADHGLIDEAAAILSNPPEHLPFPFVGATNVIAGAKDEATRRRILEGAVRAYRRDRREARGRHGGFGRSAFVSLFGFHWPRLPREMALETVHDLVQDALDEEDEPVRASADQVRFSSSRQHRLFQILGPLRQLDSSKADSLIAEYPQLAKAAGVMPFGMYPPAMPDAGHQPAPEQTAASHEQPDVMIIGDRLVPMPEMIATGFVEAFAVADRKFETDANGGNAAPKEAWPSAAEYRAILYKAGRHQGRVAAEYLARVPDTDLQILAGIELAAALAGLPQVGGITISPGGRDARPARRSEPIPPEIIEMMRRRQHQPLPRPVRPNLPPSRDVRISSSSRQPGTRMGGGAGSDFWLIEGAPLKPVLTKIYDMPETRIEMSPALERDRFDFALVLPGDESPDTMTRLMREGISRHFDVRRELHERDVYVLTAPVALKLKPALRANLGAGSIGFTKSGADDEGDFETADLRQILDLHMAGEAVSVDMLQSYEREIMRQTARDSRGGALTSLHGDYSIGAVCEALEGSLDRLVVDETGLTGSYEFHIDTEAATTLAFLEALGKTTGIVVAAARRHVPMLVVRLAQR